ncbi:MAG: hypothetical protein IJ552_00890 [Prevotella sp.]|nr:hypothetical protein [Prevotella sp.]
MMNILEELSIVSNFPQLRERAMLNICSWKAEHENVYKKFKNKMDNISAGDLSALDAMFGLASDCMSDKPTGKKVSSLPGFGSADEIWHILPQYAKSYIAEASKDDDKATKDDCLSLIEEATDYMNTCMSFVPSFVSNLKAKAMDEENDVIRCMYYYMMFDGGSTKMIETLNTILNDDILDQEDMAMIHGAVDFMVPSSIDLGVETKESWEKVANSCDPEIWKDISYELSKSEGNRGRKVEIKCIDSLLIGNKSALKAQILCFIKENPEAICLAYLLKALIRAEAIKESVSYASFHRAIEQFTGRKYGIDSPQRRFGEIKDFGFHGVQKGSWAKAKEIIFRWSLIFEAVA